MRRALYIGLIAIGSLQMLGYVLGSRAVRGIGAVTAAAPLPVVFTEVNGVETFASDFFVLYDDAQGSPQVLKITPALYKKLAGPYNRRNVYGAAISYGPVLPEPIWQSILQYGICDGPLATELGLPADAANVHIEIKTRTQGRNDAWTLTPNCP